MLKQEDDLDFLELVFEPQILVQNGDKTFFVYFLGKNQETT